MSMMLLMQCEAFCYRAKIKLKSESVWLQPTQTYEAEPEILIERGDGSLCAKRVTWMALKSANQLCHLVMQIMLKVKRQKSVFNVTSCHIPRAKASPLILIQEGHILVSSSAMLRILA